MHMVPQSRELVASSSDTLQKKQVHRLPDMCGHLPRESCHPLFCRRQHQQRLLLVWTLHSRMSLNGIGNVWTQMDNE